MYLNCKALRLGICSGLPTKLDELFTHFVALMDLFRELQEKSNIVDVKCVYIIPREA